MMFTAQEISEATGFPTYEQMKEWCDANAEGRLVVLPCKVGDAVFVLNASVFHKNEVYESKISSIRLDTEGMCILGGGFFGRIDGLLNKTVFLTREEAEAALKEADNG